MTADIVIKQLSNHDEAKLLDYEFTQRYPWYRSGDYYERCLKENIENNRITLLAFYKGRAAGCCHLLFVSEYPSFQNENIPEINDLNVFPEYRRKGIASRLFDELESIASKKSKYVGLGVGLYRDYGNAQIMYSKRGYVMDGKGLSYNNTQVEPGQTVMVDDELLMYLIKEL
ncbi:GNAT family N-acetyltransferase [Paenibacillus camelliae]|uniref:GNAT family N-acetyltransferase n=1 Tax=Paenibacillus camelliae TaxID=512410 RepID=UPI00203A9BE5|nr:GNAT family N-acetyltransferase [Paenibacillus camelliae]MCM3633643.1 GNAT family N-acetyltransferase [Paenibacillus camelliae]